MTRTITWTIVAIVVIAGGWYLLTRTQSAQQGTAATSYQPGQTGTVAQQNATTGGTSNSDLDQGLSSIDTQMNAAASASASANDTSDNPVAQTE